MTAVMQGVRDPRGRRAHVRPRGLGAARRLGRRGHQDRARRAGRRHARPGVQRHGRRSGHGVHVLLEHSNRGKQSLGARPHLGGGPRHPLQAGGDVRRLPHQQAPERPHEAADRRRRHPGPQPATSSTSAAPARASGGPTPTAAPTTSLAYWCRAGVAMGTKQPEYDYVPAPPAPAFGDSIGAMTIAGGIMGALFHRERTGEATTVDVSLLGIGLWSMGAALALSLQLDVRLGPAAAERPHRQPARRHLHDQGRHVPGAHLPPGGEVLARGLRGHRAARARHRRALRRRRGAQAERRRPPPSSLREAFAERTADEWREQLAGFSRAVDHRAGHARGRGRPADRRQRLRRRTARPRTASRSSSPPRRSSTTGSRPQPERAPEFNEHGDAILGRPRPRLGRDRGPQGPRRRRLTQPPDTTHHHQEQRHGHCSTHSGTTASGRSSSAAPPAWAPRPRELVKDAGAEVVVMDRAEVTLPGVKAIQRRPRRQGLDRRRRRRVRRAGARAVLVRRRGRRHARHRAINFIGHRHIIDRLLADDMLPRGSAIGLISSAAGFGWEQNLDDA